MKIEFDVGKTRHGQPIKLLYERGPNGDWAYAIRKEAANQRDDTVLITGIEPGTMDLIIEAVQTAKRPWP